QTWTELLERHLARTCPPDEAHRKALRWGAAFSTEYRASSSPAEAAADLGVIEAMEADDRLLDVRLSNRPMNGSADTQDFTWLNVYVRGEDRKSTRLNSSHVKISYAVFCLKK